MSSTGLSSAFFQKLHNLDCKKDSEELKKALLETNQRIKKLEEHKELVNKKLRDSNSNNSNDETLRRLERNLINLHKKRALITKELEE